MYSTVLGLKMFNYAISAVIVRQYVITPTKCLHFPESL